MRPLSSFWRVVGVWAGSLALLAVAGFFLKVSVEFSRLLVRRLVPERSRADPCAALHRLARDPQMGAQRQDGAARADRRRRQGGGIADPLGREPALQRHPHLRHLRRPRRPALAADRRRLSEARQHLRTDRIRPHRAHRHADRLAAADGRGARAVAAARSSGCCRSTSASRPIPTSCISGRAPIPSSARCRCSTSSTSRSTTGIRSPSAPSTSCFSLIGIVALVADHAGDRHRHQARQQGPGPLQAEAPRLQQRGHRGLQVPLDVYRNVRSDAPSRR